MAEQSKAERLVDVATHDKRAILVEAAISGIAIAALIKKFRSGEPSEDISSVVVNRRLEDDNQEIDVFIQTYTKSEEAEGTPFNMGVLVPDGGSYKSAAISGIIDKPSGVINSLRTTPELLVDQQWLERVKGAISKAHDIIKQEASENGQ